MNPLDDLPPAPKPRTHIQCYNRDELHNVIECAERGLDVMFNGKWYKVVRIAIDFDVGWCATFECEDA